MLRIKDIPIAIALTCFGLVYSQSSIKERVFYDENWKALEKNDFDKKLTNYNLYTSTFIQNDSLIISRLLLREEFGKITVEQKNLLIYYLKRITNVDIDSTQNIVINFFIEPKSNPKGSCIDHYTSDYKYKRYFKKNNHSVQLFFTERGYIYEKKGVYEDKKNFIKPLFFNDDLGCGNYVIIKDDGTFLRVYGEYRQADIPEKITATWDALTLKRN
jgi:hypothetical protein